MDNSVIRCFVGFDSREAIAFHVFCQSVIDTASQPVAFIPLHKPKLAGFDGQRDGSNAFTFSLYLVPRLCNYKGWAIFVDGDMICRRDLKELWDMRNEYIDKAAAVVKHDYLTRHAKKYVGSKMESENKDYPKKNHSSVILWNCAHFANRCLDEEYVKTSTPEHLHRFGWLAEDQIASLPMDWNYLVREYPPASAHLYHFTLGIPALRHYADDFASWNWHESLLSAMQCGGEDPVGIAARAQARIG